MRVWAFVSTNSVTYILGESRHSKWAVLIQGFFFRTAFKARQIHGPGAVDFILNIPKAVLAYIILKREFIISTAVASIVLYCTEGVVIAAQCIGTFSRS